LGRGGLAVLLHHSGKVVDGGAQGVQRLVHVVQQLHIGGVGEGSRPANFLKQPAQVVYRLAQVVAGGVHKIVEPAAAQLPEPVAFTDLAADVLETLRPQVQDTHAVIELDFSDLAEVPCVRSNLRTILLNLVANALKYRHPDRAPHVGIRSYCAEGQPVLEVQDNGLGL
nr:hypothetical protein [Tanacetum cinerariifolium]